MHVSGDRRKSCNGGEALPIFGGCGGVVTKTNDSSVWTNVTTFASYNPTGSWLTESYVRLDNGAQLPSCATMPDCASPNPPCGEWPTGSLTGSGSDLYIVGKNGYENYFEESGSTTGSCLTNTKGYKAVQASKVWHGTYGLLSHDPAGCYDINCSGNDGESAQYTADTTKYLTVTRTFDEWFESTYTRYFTGSFLEQLVENVNSHQYRQYSVGRHDGVITQQPQETTYVSSSQSFSPSYTIHQPLSPAAVNVARQVKVSCGKIYFPTDPSICELCWPDGLTPTELENYFYDVQYTASYADTEKSYSIDRRVSASVKLTNTYLSIDKSIYVHVNDSSSVDLGLSGSYVANGHMSIKYELSNEYTADNVKDDMYNQLATWDFGDHLRLPFRTDAYPTIAPLVTYDEFPSAVSPDVEWSSEITDSNAAIYTGKILGEPLESGSHFFDANHKTYKKCYDGTMGVYVWYIYSYGAWSGIADVNDTTDALITPYATQWTNQRDAADKVPVGAYLYMDNQIGYAGKWQESLISRPSLNFARPCGVDKYEPNYETSSCIFSIVDNVVNPWTVAPFETSGSILICGTGTNDGIWKATTTDGTTIQLDELIVSGSEIPANITTNNSCGTGRISSLKWFGSGDCGRNYVVSASALSPFTCSLERDHYFYSGEIVWAVDSNNIPTPMSCSYVDRKTVSLIGADATDDIVYLQSPFSADWKWDDDSSKRDFVILNYIFDYRTIAEISRLQTQYNNYGCGDNPASIRTAQVAYGIDQSISEISCEGKCIEYGACGIASIMISPNKESITSKSNYRLEFPQTINMDGRYGSRWQAVPKQWMEDPFWDAPAKPCTVSGESTDTWVEDNGECIGDYPLRPYIEGRCGVPDGAPLLIVPFGVATLEDLDAGNPFDKVVYAPEIYVGSPSTEPYPTEVNLPIVIYERQKTCVNTAGSFADTYIIRDGVMPDSEYGI